MKVVLLSHIFWPEPADFKVLPLARDLIAAGHEVIVVTAIPSYPMGRFYDGYTARWSQWEDLDGLKVLRVLNYPDHSASGVKRALNYTSFTASAAINSVAKLDRFDVLFIYAPPMTLGLAGSALKVMKGCRVLLDVVDLWPDAVAASEMSSVSLSTRTAAAFARQAYRSADAITVVSEGFKKAVVSRLPIGSATTVEVVYPWSTASGSPTPDVETMTRLGLNDKFVITYAGNIGPMQNLPNVLRAAAMLRDRRDIAFLLVGAGRDDRLVRQQIASDGLSNVIALGSVDRDRVGGILAASDASLLSLADDDYLATHMPSKMAEYLATGVPVVCSCPGESAQLVRDWRAGLVAQPDNPASLAEKVRVLADMPREERERMSDAARRLYDSKFDRAKGLSRYRSMIERLGSG